MNALNANRKFIEDWSILAGSLGFTRSTSQVFALLLVSDRRLTYTEIMDKLKISRGNAHQSLHRLVDLKLIYKFHQLGDRKEYFEAETNLWIVFEKMIMQFKHRSLDKLIERISENPVRKINKTSAHLENIKRNLKSILKEYTNMFDQFPKMTHHHALNGHHPVTLKKSYAKTV